MRNFLAEKFSISANAYYLCGVVKMLPPRQRYEKGVRLTNFRTTEMQTTDEIKEWQTHSVKHKVAFVLILDGVSFSYDEENGIVSQPRTSM